MKCKPAFIIVIIIHMGFYAKSQPGFVQNDRINTVKVFDANGRSFVNPLIDIEGSPYLNDKWNYATVKLNDNSVHKSVPVRFNLYSEKVHFLSSNGSELTFIPGFVKEFTYVDSSNDMKIYTFRNGFPPINGQTQNSYYHVLSDGKIKYVRYLQRKVQESKNDISGEISKRLISYEDYYILNGASIKLLKRNKEFLLQEMIDKKAEIENFLNNNKINFKDPEKIKPLIDYYNTL